VWKAENACLPLILLIEIASKNYNYKEPFTLFPEEQ
jgi:hypothetical protein